MQIKVLFDMPTVDILFRPLEKYIDQKTFSIDVAQLIKRFEKNDPNDETQIYFERSSNYARVYAAVKQGFFIYSQLKAGNLISIQRSEEGIALYLQGSFKHAYQKDNLFATYFWKIFNHYHKSHNVKRLNIKATGDEVQLLIKELSINFGMPIDLDIIPKSSQ